MTALAVLAGCGGESDDGEAASDQPIKVMVISTLESDVFGYPEVETYIRDRAAAVNADGGIGGRKIEILACNDKNDVNEATNCAREAVQEGAVAVLNGFSVVAEGIVPALEAAGIAYVTATPRTPSEMSSKVSFPVTGGGYVNYAGLGPAFADMGCEAVGALTIQGVTASEQSVDWLDYALRSEGKDGLVARRAVPSGAPDTSSALATLQDAGADCIAGNMATPDQVKLVTALEESGKEYSFGTTTSSFTQETLDSIGPDVTEGWIMTSYSAIPTDADDPEVEQFLEETKADDPSIQGIGAWGTAKVLFAALESIDGEVDRESVMAALEGLEDPGTDMFGDFSFTEEFPVEGFNRLFNSQVLLYKIDDKGVPRREGSVDIGPVWTEFQDKFTAGQ